MQLDKIIYDPKTLAEALQEQWNKESKSFKALYPSDTATSLVNGFAAYGSMLQYMLVSAMANCYTETAFSERGIYQLAETLGNTLHGNNPAQVKVSLTKNNFVGMNVVIPKETQFEISNKKFFNPSAVALPANTETVSNVVLVQGEVITKNIVTSGLMNEKFYFSSNFKAADYGLEVTVNGKKWKVVDSFLPYDKNKVFGSTEETNVVIVKTDPEGRSYLKLGDGQIGKIPPSGSNVEIKYISNDGSEGNIPELNINGTLITPLLFTDHYGVQNNLQLTVITSTTANGGFSKQSLNVLRATSPYVFASGHRAIRRQDYNAMLQNQCGYITSAVWGEYEEAKKFGTYDSLMMNMVYYTGLKSFQIYPYFNIGNISNNSEFSGALYSVKGFLGSHAFRISNGKEQIHSILIQDTGAKGQLFINNNDLDKRDCLLPDWKASKSYGYLVVLNGNGIATPGTNYRKNDILILNDTNNEITVTVTEVGENGTVSEVILSKNRASNDYSSSHPSAFTTKYSTAGTGNGLTINLRFISAYTSDLIWTNDIRESAPPTQSNPILNARSDQNSKSFYRSLYTPTLLQPVQIIINFSNIPESELHAITGIKFKAVNKENGPFIGTFATYGTNIYPLPSLDNIRNSEDWHPVIERKTLTNPYDNDNDNWTDWIPTNTFTGELNSSNKPLYQKYKYYVIEIYSHEEANSDIDTVTIGKIKMMYDNEASTICYRENGKLLIHFPKVGSPGPDGDSDTLTEDLLNTDKYPMYAYNVKLDGITKANGYETGNLLAYKYTAKDNPLQKEITFLIDVTNIENGIYSVTINGSKILNGTEVIELIEPASLDTTLTYTVSVEKDITENQGTGYKVNDKVTIKNSNKDLVFIIDKVDLETGSVSHIIPEKPLQISIGEQFNGTYETELLDTSKPGKGLKLNLTSSCNSGKNNIPGKGGTIKIKSISNLSVDASFVGNKIDTQDINHIDQPIINKYNHFTTYLEFKQPEIEQINITAEVAISKKSQYTSSIIIQNVKNNIRKLFDITSNYMGQGLKISDVYKAIINTEDVDWCRVITPTNNINIQKNSLMIPMEINIIEKVQSIK